MCRFFLAQQCQEYPKKEVTDLNVALPHLFIGSSDRVTYNSQLGNFEWLQLSHIETSFNEIKNEHLLEDEAITSKL